MTTENTLVIRDLAFLDLWGQQLHNIIWSRNLPAVQFQLQAFSYEQNQSFSAFASSLQKACGCASSGFFMSVTVVGIVVSFFLSGNRLSDIGLLTALSFVGITVLAALFGKLLGLFWARWRLLRLAARVHKLIVRRAHGAVIESV